MADPAAWKPLIKCEGGCGQYAVTPDSSAVLMQTGRHYRLFNVYSDIVRFKLRPGQRARHGQRLTHGARAVFPQFSADARRLWVIKSRWGMTWLEALHPTSGATLYRWDPPAWARLDAPAPGRDGKFVYLSIHQDGNRDIYALNLATRKLTRLTYGKSLELELVVTSDGRYLVYSSDADGVFNIYARDLKTQTTAKLTNVLGGAFSPSVSPDGTTLVYTGWQTHGWNIYTLPFRPSHANRVAVPDPQPALPKRLVPAVNVKRQRYSPLPTMLPRSWLPTWLADSTGLARAGLVLGGYDVTGRYGTSLAVEYDFARQDISFSLALNLRFTWPDLSLKIGRYSWDGAMVIGDVRGDYRGEVWYARFDVGLPIPSMVTPMHFNTGFTVDFTRGLRVPNLKHTPDENYPQIPREGVSTAWSMSLGWADAEQPKWAITPIRGGSGAFAVAVRHPAIGSSVNAFRFTYRLNRYLQMPWHPEHVLLLRGQGGWAGGDPGRYSGFSLGGVPELDLVVALINQTPGASTFLRGFEPGKFRGAAYHLVTAEYRFPIFRARIGIETLPVFFRDLHAAVFADVGVAYSEPFDEEDLGRIRGSIGVELRLDLEIMFGFTANLRVGYARGLGDDGIDHVYLMLAPPP